MFRMTFMILLLVGVQGIEPCLFLIKSQAPHHIGITPLTKTKFFQLFSGLLNGFGCLLYGVGKSFLQNDSFCFCYNDRATQQGT